MTLARSLSDVSTALGDLGSRLLVFQLISRSAELLKQAMARAINIGTSAQKIPCKEFANFLDSYHGIVGVG